MTTHFTVGKLFGVGIFLAMDFAEGSSPPPVIVLTIFCGDKASISLNQHKLPTDVHYNRADVQWNKQKDKYH